MSVFKPLTTYNHRLRSTDAHDGEAKYWKNYKLVASISEPAAVESISFNPVNSDQLAATSSTNINFYSCSTRERLRNVSRQSVAVHCLAYRPDGALIVTGDTEGAVRLYDAGSLGKSILATVKAAHKQAIRTCAFTSDAASTTIITGGDDSCVRCWSTANAGQQDAVWESIDGHSDFVRCVRPSKMSESVFYSGSYDHSVCAWDTRMPGSEALFRLQHGSQVEDCLPMRGDTLLAVAAGSSVYIWDVRQTSSSSPSQRKARVACITSHHRAIMQLCEARQSTRFVSAGLDAHVTVYDAISLQTMDTMTFERPVLSIGISADDKFMALGSAKDNLMTIHERQYEKEAAMPVVDEGEEETNKKLTKKEMKAKAKRTPHRPQVFYWKRSTEGEEAKKEGGEVNIKTMVKEEKEERQQAHVKLLRQMQFTAALKNVLKTFRQKSSKMKSGETLVYASTVCNVLRELFLTQTLHRVIAGLDADTMAILIMFVRNHMKRTEVMPVVITTADVICDVYSSTPALDRTPVVDHQMNLLADRLTAMREEQDRLSYMNQLCEAVIKGETLPSSSKFAKGEEKEKSMENGKEEEMKMETEESNQLSWGDIEHEEAEYV